MGSHANRGDIGRNKQNVKPKGKTNKKKGQIQVRNNCGQGNYDREIKEISKIIKKTVKVISACIGIR